MPVGQLGSLNFANLVTCGHSFNLMKITAAKNRMTPAIYILLNEQILFIYLLPALNPHWTCRLLPVALSKKDILL